MVSWTNPSEITKDSGERSHLPIRGITPYPHFLIRCLPKNCIWTIRSVPLGALSNIRFRVVVDHQAPCLPLASCKWYIEYNQYTRRDSQRSEIECVVITRTSVYLYLLQYSSSFAVIVCYWPSLACEFISPKTLILAVDLSWHKESFHYP